ncbi:hypothetical protein BKA62DRAFT_693616 [Auriculariales sp. MPI-PUGE-AT-0066]|nr:hypothetical protein BKA62DRAFT_693616 [Auriculariales sp. MPI-PUGE-AT-0066]
MVVNQQAPTLRRCSGTETWQDPHPLNTSPSVFASRTTMSWAASTVLFLVHALYRAYCFVRHAWRSLVRRKVRIEAIGPLSKKPQHLGVILAQRTDFQSPEHVEAMTESACRVVDWCRQLQIPHVSVYDRTGTLLSVSRDIVDELDAERIETQTSTTLHPLPPRDKRPLTPPPSEHSQATSRSWSPEPAGRSIVTLRCPSRDHVRDDVDDPNLLPSLRKRHHLPSSPSSPPFTVTLHLLSRDAGKPQLAEAAQRLARLRSHSSDTADIKTIDAIVFGMTGLPEVDLMIVHPLSGTSNWPIELHGFPPWQIRLAEIYYDAPRPFDFVAWWKGSVRSLSEDAFCMALRMYGGAEFRVGK